MSSIVAAVSAANTSTDPASVESSSNLLSRAMRVMPGGVNTCRRKIDPPLCFRNGHGSRIEDLEGRSYIDYHAAYGAILLGHAYEPVVEAVRKAIGEAQLFGVGVTPAELALAEKVVEHVPSAEQIVMCNSGSEATYHAIRLARGVTGRQKIVKFQGSYNGFHDYVLRNVMSAPELVGGRDPGSDGMLDEAVDSTLVCRFNDLDDVAETLAREEGEVAAIILEPVAHNMPGILPGEGFLEGLRKLCDDSGALLIFDEVITGFRHALGGYQSVAGVTPDITTLGKGLGNGFPVAVIAGRADHLEHFNTTAEGRVHFGGTYNGNVMAATAALTTIEVLESEPVHEHIYGLGETMRSGLNEIASRAGVEAVALGYGSLYCLCFLDGPVRNYEDVLRNDVPTFLRYRHELIARGVFEMPENLGRNHISYSHTEEDVARTLEIAEEALMAAREPS
jgi:glutamate-1-semialdehyde 2,1-aminomutase